MQQYWFNNGTPKFSDHPYKHWIIDDFLYPEMAEALAESFPNPENKWFVYNTPFEKQKLIQDDIAVMPPLHSWALMFGNSRPQIDLLERITQIDGLIADPWLRGGGLHQTLSGGKLDIHCDFNWHKKLKLDRRLNALLYLNKDWQEEWGGHLELWDKNMSACQIKITPQFNRLVVFETTDFSFHGHPDPMTCPQDVTRKSMAWYYYTNGRPEHEKSEAHAAMFKKRPNEETTEEIEKLRELRNHGSDKLAKN